jgi:thiol-disulfide isomerase/thioredoxin
MECQAPWTGRRGGVMVNLVRWLVAASAVTALVYTMVPALPSPAAGVQALTSDEYAADEGVCPAGAKKANLNFTVTDMNGAKVNLAAFEGKVIVLDFWATWCPPCKAEIPGFVELQQTYGSKGLQFVGISVDSEDTPAMLKDFATQYKMNYPVLVGGDRDDLQDAYGPMWGIPTTFVIGRDGRICRKNSGLVGKAKYETDIKGLL